MALPYSSFVLKSEETQKYVQYNHNKGLEPYGGLQANRKEVLSPFTKLQFEEAKGFGGRYVNIRSSYNNKYWRRYRDDSEWIVAHAAEPNESDTEPSSTLFEPIPHVQPGNNAYYSIYLRHVQLGFYVRPDKDYNFFLVSKPGEPQEEDIFAVIDWDSLVILPKYVSFKVYNDKSYLRAQTINNHNYLTFSDTDGTDPAVANEVYLTGDGSLRIIYTSNTNFWRRNSSTDHALNNWILVDPKAPRDKNTLFWADRVNANPNPVALRSLGNKKFIKRETDQSVVNGLRADASSSNNPEARLVVKELVQSRVIFEPKFYTDPPDASITYTDNVHVTVGTATNPREDESITIDISLVYSDTKTSTWNTIVNDPSFSSLIHTTLSSPKHFVDRHGHIFRSGDYTGHYKWGETITEEIPVQCTVQVSVPPLTTVKVTLLATKASVDIPFDYYQTDTLSYDDKKFRYPKKEGGVYTGVCFTNFHTEPPEVLV